MKHRYRLREPDARVSGVALLITSPPSIMFMSAHDLTCDIRPTWLGCEGIKSWLERALQGFEAKITLFLSN